MDSSSISTESSTSIPSTRIPESALTQSDILCGRGTKYCSHPGNKTYHMICKANSNAYKNAQSKDEKTKITRSIVDKLRNLNPPSRFVQRDDKGGAGDEQHQEVEWFDIGERKAWEKTSQLLREMVSKGDHSTVYQKRKWDKEVKRLEIRNAKRIRPDSLNLPPTSHRAFLPISRTTTTTPRTAPAAPAPFFMLSPQTSQDNLSSRAAARLLEASPDRRGLIESSSCSAMGKMNDLGGLQRPPRRPAVDGHHSQSLRWPACDDTMVSQQLYVSSNNPLVIQYQNSLRNHLLLNNHHLHSSIMGQTMMIPGEQSSQQLNSCLNAGCDPLDSPYAGARGTHPSIMHATSMFFSRSDLMRPWLDQKPPTMTEIEYSTLLMQRRLLSENRQQQEISLLQRKANVLAASSLQQVPSSSAHHQQQRYDDYMMKNNNLLRHPPWQQEYTNPSTTTTTSSNTTSTCPKSVTPPTTGRKKS